MRRYALPTLLLSLGLGASGAAGAAAIEPSQLPQEERSQGLWYTSEWFNFDKLAERGATGDGVKIAVIDSAVNLDVPELQGANIEIMGSTCMDPGTGKPWEAMSTDPVVSAHGTNVVSTLVGNGVAGDGGAGARGIVPDAEIMFYGVGPVEPNDEEGRQSYWSSCVLNDPTVPPGEVSFLEKSHMYSPLESFDNSDGEVEGLAKTTVQLGDSTAIAALAAIRDGADVVSISVDSGDTLAWEQVMIEALAAGVPVVIGTSNPTDDRFSEGLTKTYQKNGIVAVNAIEQDGGQLRGGKRYAANGSSNLAFAAPGRDLLGVGVAEGWGPELIHGTSYATPQVAGTIALGLQKFPEATANQVLQAMIRTTGPDGPHDPEWSETAYGYGFVNPGSMLNVDPTEFPDENPLYVTTYEDPRCATPPDWPGGVQPGSTDGNGNWHCYWALSPTPETEAAYWAEQEAATQTPGGPAKPAAGDETAFPVWIIVAGGIGTLVIIAAAVLVPLLVSRARKRRAGVQGPGPHQGQLQYAPPAQPVGQQQYAQPGHYGQPGQHAQPGQHPNSQQPGGPGAPNSGGQS